MYSFHPAKPQPPTFQFTLNQHNVRAELRDEANRPIPGLTLGECKPLSGDQVHGVVTWTKGNDVSALAVNPLRLHLVIRDADVYAFEFRK
jgi:hypothetical protein